MGPPWLSLKNSCLTESGISPPPARTRWPSVGGGGVGAGDIATMVNENKANRMIVSIRESIFSSQKPSTSQSKVA